MKDIISQLNEISNILENKNLVTSKEIKKTKEEDYGQEVIISLHNVPLEKFKVDLLKDFAKELCLEIGMKLGPSYHWGEDKQVGTAKEGSTEEETKGHIKADGISVVQFLYESSVTIHALDEIQKVFINCFSCKKFSAEKVKDFTLKKLNGNMIQFENITRP